MDGYNCHGCGVLACYEPPGTKEFPAHCPMRLAPDVLAQAQELARREPERSIAQAAARTEGAGYCRWTRIEEIMHFTRQLGVTRIGIACCIGLRREADIAQRIFKAGGFEVTTAICKAGAVPKEDYGLSDAEKIRPGGYETICNPIGQAQLLDKAGCGLNVVIGLCVGHDSLFFKHSQAPCTVLVAKDRVLGHNPCAALYTAGSYYKHLVQEP